MLGLEEASVVIASHRASEDAQPSSRGGRRPTLRTRNPRAPDDSWIPAP